MNFATGDLSVPTPDSLLLGQRSNMATAIVDITAATVHAWPRLLLLLAAVAFGMAAGRCSRYDALEIKRCWEQPWNVVSTQGKIAYAKAIYDAVHALDPAAARLIVDPDTGRASLEEIYSDGELSIEFLRSLQQHDVVINMLADDNVLQQHLLHLARQKMSWMHAQMAHFQVLAAAFMQ